MDRREFLCKASMALAGVALAPFGRAIGIRWENLSKDAQGKRYAEGIVFHDTDGTGKRKPNSRGVPGVCISNGREVVKTDKDGKWRLPVDENCVLFIVKPSGWKTPLSKNFLPQFYYIHSPEGSPEFKYKGLSPTGQLPESIDFPLQPQRESNKFRVILFGDPQPRNQIEIDYISHDVVEQVARDVIAVDAKFGLSLGDEMFDDLSLFESLNRTIATIGLPWYNTVGNHDMNYDAKDDEMSTETFKRMFGPTYYSFDYARVHFMVLDDVVWQGAEQGGYRGEIAAKQLQWIRNDLAEVPMDRLIVIAMHIPLGSVINRGELFRIIENRPYVFSLSAHTHVQANIFYGEKEGWKGATPHHHLNNATVCGSWWQGAPDERGIPHATMSDGGPNGYSIAEFDGNRYKITFRPASRPENEQMSIWIPEEINPRGATTHEIIVNVFAGSERSTVEMRLNDGDWQKMTQIEGQDPYFLKLKELEALPTPPPGLKLPKASLTKHLWKINMPSISQGTHAIEVRTTDMYGQMYSDRRIFRVA